MPNLRGSTDRKHHGREQERSGRDRNAESDDKFDFRSAEEGSAEEFGSKREGSSRKKEPKPASHGGDEANKGEKAKTETWFDVDKGLKTKNEMETTSSDESGNRSEAINLVRMFDSGTLNQLRPCRGKGNKRGANTVTAK